MFREIKIKLSKVYGSPLANRLKNRYFLSGVFFILWMTFLDTHSLKIHYKLYKEITETKRSIEYYKTEIEKDRELLKQLESNPEMLEKFAREQYYFKRPGEHIYIIDISD